ncbi:RHS repeat-associated protein [Kerstersia similis]
MIGGTPLQPSSHDITMPRQPVIRFMPRRRTRYSHHILTGLQCALMSVVLHASHAQDATTLSCTATQLGQPCAGPGLTSPGTAEPALNLGLDNPVHLASGRKFLRDTDLPAHPLAPGLELVRYYNSADPRRHTGPGTAWQFSYDLRLYRLGDSLQLIQADGSRLRFPCLPGQTLCQHEGQGSLHAQPDGWQWHWPDGSQLDFRQDGWLVAIRRPDGVPLARITRAADGRLLIVRSMAPERQLVFHYEQHAHPPYVSPRLHSVETPMGRFHYHHAAGPEGWQLTRVERPDGMQRHYAHDPSLQSGHPHAITASGLAASGQPVRWQRRWHYDHDARVVRLEHLDADGQVSASWQLEYLEPAYGIHAGLTRVHGPQGATDIRFIQHGGRYLLAQVAGTGCPGCPAPGLHAQYDSAGRLAALNHLRLTRHPGGAVRELDVPDSGWPGLRLRFDDHGRQTAWYSQRTGLTRWQYARHHSPTSIQPQAAQLSQQSILYANGDRWYAMHDALGRPVQVTASRFPANAGAPGTATPPPAALEARLQWHPQHGHLLALTHPHEAEQRDYDAAGRLQARHIQRPDHSHAPAIQLTDRYDYHPDGRLAHHYLPEGGLLAYQWQHGRLHRLDWQDRHGQRHPILRALPGEAGYVFGNGVHTLGLRDERGLRALVSALPGAGSPLLAQAITLDSLGRIAEEHIQTGDWRQHQRYGYDATGRLAMIEDAAASPRHTADLTAHTHTPAPALPAHQQPRTYLAWSADGSLQRRHTASDPAAPSGKKLAAHVTPPKPISSADASGLPRHHNGWRLSYDPQRRLQLAVHPASGQRIEYRHNAHGQRILRADGPDITHYLYNEQGQRLAQARTRSDQHMQVTERYLYAGQVPVAWLRYDHAGEARLYFIHADAQGLPRALSDTRGQLSWRAEFDAFGLLLREEGGTGPALRYPGQYADPRLPWYDNGMRTYDPLTGSFLEPDPLGPLPGHAAYGYAAQRPRQYADPSGMLLYAFDGTRNTPASRTNVWLLHQLYPGDSHYQPGPGQTAWDAATASRATRIINTQWERLLADLAAAGRQWQQEPAAIDLLGYSRGAALAQHFANQIAAHVSNQRFWAYDPVMGTVSACVDLRFMGLFDTVAQFGVNGRDNGAYQLGPSPAWQWIAHAVALNEQRYLFPLNSLDQGQGNVVELPFIGAHADIGGGYLSSATPAHSQGDLSDVALAWMHWQALAAGVPLAPLPSAHASITQPLLHDERNVFYRKTGQDRAVHRADGSAWLDSQAEHTRLGQASRQAVEAFIERLPDWMHAPGNVVGTVDMAAYEQWLKQQMPH